MKTDEIPPKYVVFHIHETLLGSILSDAFTYGGLAAIYWLTSDVSPAWQVFITVMFLLMIVGRSKKSEYLKFSSAEKLIEWAEQQAKSK